MKVLIFILISLFASNSVFCQKEVEKVFIDRVEGSAIGSEAESASDILNRALADAKANALKKAGVEESIAASDMWLRSENNDKIEELFSSDIFSDIRGNVVNVEVLSDNRSFVEGKMLKIDVAIRCNVVRYLKEKDRTFEAKILGVQAFYKNGEVFKFSVKPSKSCYLKVFAFNKNETFPIFPTEYEASFNLKKNVEYAFPVRPDMEYALETDRRNEPHKILFVLLKEDFPYNGKMTYKDISDWLFSIPPSQRWISTETFVLVNESGE